MSRHYFAKKNSLPFTKTYLQTEIIHRKFGRKIRVPLLGIFYEWNYGIKITFVVYVEFSFAKLWRNFSGTERKGAQKSFRAKFCNNRICTILFCTNAYVQFRYFAMFISLLLLLMINFLGNESLPDITPSF